MKLLIMTIMEMFMGVCACVCVDEDLSVKCFKCRKRVTNV